MGGAGLLVVATEYICMPISNIPSMMSDLCLTAGGRGIGIVSSGMFTSENFG